MHENWCKIIFCPMDKNMISPPCELCIGIHVDIEYIFLVNKIFRFSQICIIAQSSFKTREHIVIIIVINLVYTTSKPNHNPS